MINTALQAKHHVKHLFDKANTLVVSQSGDVYMNCNVEEACKELDSEKKKYYILKGEKPSKKKLKDESETK